MARHGRSASPLTLSLPETAQLLGISRNLLYSAARSGEFPPARRVRRRIVVGRAALEAWLESGMPAASSPEACTGPRRAAQ